ncbi:FtsQ-type POTRA domain-containing protein [Corynebacterium sp. CCM 9185]|uniref:FtsQ-type POTRA domain-containing protein n=1 Tax=Corynebacterium marambiense TaxID=2765364 RepID=A0ABS0VVS9_9CORY|nr:FtsQ-type POTRA domain-containing protein [Corynebacterium marambiense]MCK7662875.1 FtsQ-type POTRA domain-containing protein [Corynebacterium marambiense]
MRGRVSWIAGGLTLIVCLGLLPWFIPVVKVGEITVTGAQQTAEGDVVAATGVVPGANMVRVDAGRAARNVAALPWVERAHVERHLPGTVSVEVTERAAVLYAARSDGNHLIDASGVPFIIGAPPVGAVEITDTREDDRELFAGVAAVVESLDEPLRAQVTRVRAPGPYEIALILLDGREVYWGAPENNHDKSRAASAALSREGRVYNVSDPVQVTVRQ